jgi:hypothetical protein
MSTRQVDRGFVPHMEIEVWAYPALRGLCGARR